MWKGYRDARCAWLESESTLDRKKSRYELEVQPSTALFLIIFAPRRGLLEAWSMQVLLIYQIFKIFFFIRSGIIFVIRYTILPVKDGS